MNPVFRAFAREHQAGFAVLAAFVCISIATIEFASALARSNRSWRETERELAQLVAEEAAFRACEDAGAATVARNGMTATAALQGNEITIGVACGKERTYEYVARVVPGTAPALLAVEQGVGIPPLSDEALAAPALASGCSYVVRDDSIGLLRSTTGTDLVDWSLRPEQDGVVRPHNAEPTVARIDGHLWIDRDARPLVVELTHALTLVVEGNLYLGRSLLVHGPGRLTLVTHSRPGLRFHDLDGNGRHSDPDEVLAGLAEATPIEGSGTIYLGLPDHGDANARIACEATLWAHFDAIAVESHFVARAPVLAGLRHLLCGDRASLQTEPARPVATEREWIPGFRTTGGPRPGQLARR